MPVPADVVKVTLRATLGGQNVEEAQFGFNMRREHFTGNPTDWAGDVQDIADLVAAKWVSHMTTKIWWASSVQMATCETYHLDSEGHTLDKGLHLFEGDTQWTGSGSDSLPWETSCVASLYAYQPGGFAPDRKYKRGRFYLPPLVTGFMDAGKGRYQAGGSFAVQPLHTQVLAFLNDVNGLELGPGLEGKDNMRLGILSKTSGVFYRATYLRMDTAPDVQRRRQRSMPVDYYTGAINQS